MPYKDPTEQKAHARRYYLENKARVAAWHKAWREANPEKKRAVENAWVAANPDRVREIKRQSAQRRRLARGPRPQVSEADKARRKRWVERNPHYGRVAGHRYLAAKLQRTPSWFGELDEFVLEEAARLCVAREEVTGFPWEIDHAVPLRGKVVSGLHVWNNFSVIPAQANRLKNNRFQPQ
jgi:hypothetical protein